MSAIDTLEQRMSRTSRRPLVDWLLWICSTFRPILTLGPGENSAVALWQQHPPADKMVVVDPPALDADSVFDELDHYNITLNKLKE
jgi:hypothetical protein